MKEKVLGALIIGGITIIGIVWGSIEGAAALGRAKSNEKSFETDIKQKIAIYNDTNVSKFDCRMVKYDKKEITEYKEIYEGRWSNVKTVTLFVDVTGYTDDAKLFTIGIKTSNDYVLDVDGRFNVDKKDDDLLKHDIYQNYTMTSSKLLKTILDNPESSIYQYVLDGSEKFKRVFNDDGTHNDFVNGIEVKNTK